MAAVRGLFAMSFDRQLPLSAVLREQATACPRRRPTSSASSPSSAASSAWATRVGTASAGVMLAILDWTALFFIWTVGLAGLFLPFTRPDLFEKATFQKKWFGRAGDLHHRRDRARHRLLHDPLRGSRAHHDLLADRYWPPSSCSASAWSRTCTPRTAEKVSIPTRSTRRSRRPESGSGSSTTGRRLHGGAALFFSAPRTHLQHLRRDVRSPRVCGAAWGAPSAARPARGIFRRRMWLWRKGP